MQFRIEIRRVNQPVGENGGKSESHYKAIKAYSRLLKCCQSTECKERYVVALPVASAFCHKGKARGKKRRTTEARQNS